MKRGRPPKRTKWLQSSRKPIPARRKDPSRRAFAKRRDSEYQAWIREQPCIVRGHPTGHRCLGDVQCCHVRTRGSGGNDLGNCFPACAGAHQLQHAIGIKSWQELYGIELAVVATELTEAWLRAADSGGGDQPK